MAKMNVFHGVGQVTNDAKVFAGEKNSKVSFSIAINLPAGTETKAHYFQVETWVKPESKLVDSLKKGVCVNVSGKLLETTKTRKDGTTYKEAYIQANRVNVVKDGWSANYSDIEVHVFAADEPKARGKTTALRIGLEGLYNKENQTNNVMFMDAIYFGDNAERVLKYIGKGDSMNIIGTLVTYKYTNKDGTDTTVCQILAREYPDVTRRRKGAENVAEPAAPAMNAPIVDDDDEALPF